MRTLARAQAELGADVTVLCVNHASSEGEDVTWRRFTRTPTAVERDGAVRVVRLGRVAEVAKLDVCPGAARALAAMRREPPDILHLHVPNPTLLLALCASPATAPLVVTYHSDVVRQHLRGAVLRPFERIVLSRAGAILCTSAAYARGSAILARHLERIHIVPHGIELEPFSAPARAALAERDRLLREHAGPLWLAVGRLVYYKGLRSAIEALASVPGTLLVIGDGPLRGELGRRADDMGVGARVRWLGHVPRDTLVGAYHAATALWFPSDARSEAFGLVQVEAMASGCPVINASIPNSGVPWVSVHGESGVTIPVGDSAALAEAALALYRDRSLRQGLADGARRRAAAFGHRAMAARTLAVYRDVLAGGPVPGDAADRAWRLSSDPPLAADRREGR